MLLMSVTLPKADNQTYESGRVHDPPLAVPGRSQSKVHLKSEVTQLRSQRTGGLANAAATLARECIVDAQGELCASRCHYEFWFGAHSNGWRHPHDVAHKCVISGW